MRFDYALALLLIPLICIPILILIYIIKNRYTEKVIPSTYIWSLSEKFLKRRVPISKIAGILSLILQILLIVVLGFATAHPIITIPNAASSYCFVLDGSGSMHFEQGGKTRFDIAKNEIAKIINKSMNGSDYTLIYAGSTTEVIYENITDKHTAKQVLTELNCDYSAVDISDARDKVQNYFYDNPSTLVYFVTDMDYIMYDNVRLINVSDDSVNYAVTNVSYGLSGGRLKVSGTAISYATDEVLTIELYFDGEETPSYTEEFVIADLDGGDFEFNCTDRTAFRSFTVRIANEDDLPLDNEVTIYDVAYENVSEVLLVSDSPFFIKAALTSAGIGNVEVLSTKEYEAGHGYGLYIFDTFTPAEMPNDGAVWFFNPKASIAGSNFSYQGNENEKKSPDKEYTASYSDSTEKLVSTLLDGVMGTSFKMSDYAKCGLISKFTTLITCDGFPLLFVGNNTFGNREVVFAFDVHDSAQFTLMSDFSTLVGNLVGYSFPTVIEETLYSVGDSMIVNVVAGCNDIRIETPAGKTVYLDATYDVCEYQLGEVGVYKILLFMKDGSERVINVFATIPEEERSTFAFGEDFTIFGIPEDEKYDGFIDIILYLFIALGVLAVADYGIYCYEQYQLR